MTRGKGKQLLSVTEIENIKSERQDLEGALREAEESGKGTPAEQIDKGAIRTQIKRLDMALEMAKPEKLSGRQQDDLHKREQELEERFQKGLPSRYEMDHPAKCPGAVKKHMRWLIENKAYLKEYKNIQRQIRPGEERGIEVLRKDGQRGAG